MSKSQLFIGLSLLIFGCKNNDAPNVSHIQADVNWVRTEQAIFDIQSKDQLSKTTSTHPDFYDIYFKNILPIYQGTNEDSLFTSFIAFSKDSLVQDTRKKVDAQYKNLGDVEQQTKNMYQYLQYYFPEKKSIPNLYTFVSDFGYQIFIFQDDDKKDGIAIGLDMFLHPKVDYKMIDPKNTNFSDYITRSWNKDHIVKKIADLHVNDIIGEAPGHRMLDQMIHNGKGLYLLKRLMPEAQDSIIHEYSADQMKWCRENELEMWSFFLDKKLFYESNPSKIAKYIYPSPQSPDMPAAAPGRTANYVGYQIVKAYMDRFPNTSIQDLLQLKDSQLFLEQSKYKPKKK
ncbi:MAG: hypothetical protein U0T36_01525 [Saprospiraceae bacterium]|jgi:hypothetical protein